MLESKLTRRLLSIPAVFLCAALLTIPMPIAMPLALRAPPTVERRGTARTLAFVWCFLWCETIGVLVACWLWIRHRNTKRFLDANFRLQCAWSAALKRSAERLFRLEFDVGGREALVGPGAIMMPRHASIADTIIPMVFYAIPKRIRLRYVLKRELLLDPCLDIVGNRLPNCFVDRFADDPGPEVAKVAALADALAEDEGILIYPEGTRFSSERRNRALERLARLVDRDDHQRMHAWTDLLPPRLGGPLALLAHNPGRDLVFCAHTGFEGASHFKNLINGAWVGAHVRIRFWRVPYADIPTNVDAQRDFLFAQWDRMQETVTKLRALDAGDGQGRFLS